MDKPRRSAPPRSDAVITDERFERYHRFAREKGTSRVLYYLLRSILVPAFLIWFRLQRIGREHARVKGGLIVASNPSEWREPDKPVLQIMTPYRFVADEPVWINKLPPFYHFRRPPLPGLMTCFRPAASISNGVLKENFLS